MITYRFVEACALLPMLHVPLSGPTTVLCLGTQAEKLAADCLRWRDVQTVHLLTPPASLRDRRIEIGAPAAGTCAAVLSSPDEDADAFTGALKPEGVYCASTNDAAKVQALLRRIRALFPRSVAPWREHLPAELFGVLACPRGVPKRMRTLPGGARRLSDKYLPCLFTFAADETPLIFGPPTAKPAPEVAHV